MKVVVIVLTAIESPIGARLEGFFQRADDLARIAYSQTIWRNVLRNDTGGPNHAVRADRYSWQDYSACTDPYIITNIHWMCVLQSR